MRVLYINSVCGSGSTGRICEDLAKAVIASGGEAVICYGRNSYQGEVPTYRICGDNINKVNGVLARILDNEGRGLKQPTIKLIEFIKQYNPDMIHLHNLHGYYLHYPTLFKYLASVDIKVSWTLHDCWAFTGHCAYFDYIGCDKWLVCCGNCANKKSYPTSMLMDNSKKNYIVKKNCFTSVADMTIVTPSEWLASLVRQSFLSKYPIVTINNGINLDDFTRIDEHTFDNIIDRTKKIVLGIALPFNERKGYSDFMQLATLLSDEYQLVMVGVTDEQIASMDNKIVGIRRTNNQQQLAELYSIAEVFLNLTYEDNFPTTNIESIACGTPVICYRTGGATEMLNDNNSIILEKGDTQGVINAIDDINNMQLSSELIANEAKEKYNSSVMTAKYMNLCSLNK